MKVENDAFATSLICGNYIALVRLLHLLSGENVHLIEVFSAYLVGWLPA
jgi:hypothetical protein